MKRIELIVMIMFVTSTVLAMGNIPQTKMTTKVIDAETKLPVSNAIVRTRFLVKEHWNKADEYTELEKSTDGSGACVLEGEDMSPGQSGRVIFEGFYTSHFKIAYTGKNRVLNRWEPWNPTVEVKLRPKKSPVPMIVKRIESLKIPAWNEPLGFDLEVGDWVDPHGKGERADFFVNMSRRFEHSSDYDAVASITFPNDGDGIQLYSIPEEFRSSSYQFPYEAPTDGYKDTLVLERHATLRETKCSFNPDRDMYIFRIRTKKDEAGNITSTCYGRIDRRIEIGWGEVFDFEYHFNPVPNERSLEWNGENLRKK